MTFDEAQRVLAAKKAALEEMESVAYSDEFWLPPDFNRFWGIVYWLKKLDPAPDHIVEGPHGT